MKYILLGCTVIWMMSCADSTSIPSSVTDMQEVSQNITLSVDNANYLASLPMKCIQQAYPYKAGHTTYDAAEGFDHTKEHPAFYGCFDWHSAVHGHWSLVYLLRSFPALENREQAIQMLDENLTKENIQAEIAYFKKNRYTKSFERTYGWTWILKLAQELHEWDNDYGRKWHSNLEPLANYLMDEYINYLPKLVYPIRVGEHSNTSFGLSFAYDYAKAIGRSDVTTLIEKRTREFYLSDASCPIAWEPSGYDFLSPCLEEADMMRRILDPQAFKDWFRAFLPQVLDGSYALAPGEVLDRSDGKLVHLDGLNFSRAWCLYSIVKDHPEFDMLLPIADRHMDHSFGRIADGDYSGEHWLASFALYALQCKQRVE